MDKDWAHNESWRRIINSDTEEYIEVKQRLDRTNEYYRTNLEATHTRNTNISTATNLYRAAGVNKQLPPEAEHLTYFWIKTVLPQGDIEREVRENRYVSERASRGIRVYLERIEENIRRLTTEQVRRTERERFNQRALFLSEEDFETYHLAQERLIEEEKQQLIEKEIQREKARKERIGEKKRKAEIIAQHQKNKGWGLPISEHWDQSELPDATNPKRKRETEDNKEDRKPPAKRKG
jgi:hypothetical protein